MEAGRDEGDDDGARRLSEDLRRAFARLAQSSLPPDERQRWQERLIAVTNLAKRDVGRAERALARWDAEWADGEH